MSGEGEREGDEWVMSDERYENLGLWRSFRPFKSFSVGAIVYGVPSMIFLQTLGMELGRINCMSGYQLSFLTKELWSEGVCTRTQSRISRIIPIKRYNFLALSLPAVVCFLKSIIRLP